MNEANKHCFCCGDNLTSGESARVGKNGHVFCAGCYYVGKKKAWKDGKWTTHCASCEDRNECELREEEPKADTNPLWPNGRALKMIAEQLRTGGYDRRVR